MGDHLKRSTRGSAIPKVVGVRELKANAARILRDVRDLRASYILTHRGHAVGVILPLELPDKHLHVSDDADDAAAWNNFLEAGRQLRFRPGVSGVRILSEMRR